MSAGDLDCLFMTNAFYFAVMLLNHIVNGTYYTAGLHDGDTLTTVSGHVLNISKSPSGGTVFQFLNWSVRPSISFMKSNPNNY